jgi:hypothetical protein
VDRPAVGAGDAEVVRHERCDVHEVVLAALERTEGERVGNVVRARLTERSQRTIAVVAEGQTLVDLLDIGARKIGERGGRTSTDAPVVATSSVGDIGRKATAAL